MNVGSVSQPESDKKRPTDDEVILTAVLQAYHCRPEVGRDVEPLTQPGIVCTLQASRWNQSRVSRTISMLFESRTGKCDGSMSRYKHLCRLGYIQSFIERKSGDEPPRPHRTYDDNHIVEDASEDDDCD